MSRLWTTEETEIARRLYEQGVAIGDIRMALKGSGFARTVKAIMRKIENHGWHRMIQPSPFPIYNKAPLLTGDWLVLADPHIPFHDSDFCNDLVTHALRTGIKQVLLAGDFVDWHSFSIYGSRVMIDAGEEIKQIADFLECLDQFSKIVQIMGNHEVRLMRQLNWNLSGTELSRLYVSFAMEQKVVVSDYHWAVVETPRGRWRITHPKQARKQPCSVARDLARRHRMNVAAAHDHVCGMMLIDDARTWAISTGCCCHPMKLEYIQVVDNTRWAVAQGALIIRKGHPELLVPNSPILES